MALKDAGVKARPAALASWKGSGRRGDFPAELDLGFSAALDKFEAVEKMLLTCRDRLKAVSDAAFDWSGMNTALIDTDQVVAPFAAGN